MKCSQEQFTFIQGEGQVFYCDETTKMNCMQAGGGAALAEPAQGPHTASTGCLSHTASMGGLSHADLFEWWNPWVPSRDMAGGQKPFQPIRGLLLSCPPSGSYRPLQRANSSHKTETSFHHRCCMVGALMVLYKLILTHS